MALQRTHPLLGTTGEASRQNTPHSSRDDVFEGRTSESSVDNDADFYPYFEV